ncbi:MAG: four helix bundle protein [Saprospiraceae bacterium]|nr:four helix bundle protein [Saprospiraceae bacterium]
MLFTDTNRGHQLANGYGRYFYGENRNFCFYARGSLYESKTWLIKAMERSLDDLY